MRTFVGARVGEGVGEAVMGGSPFFQNVAVLSRRAPRVCFRLCVCVFAFMCVECEGSKGSCWSAVHTSTHLDCCCPRLRRRRCLPWPEREKQERGQHHNEHAAPRGLGACGPPHV